MHKALGSTLFFSQSFDPIVAAVVKNSPQALSIKSLENLKMQHSQIFNSPKDQVCKLISAKFNHF